MVLSGDAFGGRGGGADRRDLVADGDTGDVRRRAARLLPDHMLPTTVTAVPALPLTPNGKLDRDRLRRRVSPYRCPRHGDLVTALTGVWEEILGVPVGPDDNFFELGGDFALRDPRRHRPARAQGLPALSMRLLYTHPTVHALSLALTDE